MTEQSEDLTSIEAADVLRRAPKPIRPAHSPLGASGAERWMKCPGSVSLLKELEMDDSDDPDYRREGTAMHEAAAHCLENGLDTWEVAGLTFNETVIDEPMADAIQVYLDTVRPSIEIAGQKHYIEFAISSPVHEMFYGTLDFGAILPQLLDVTDLKGGEGIIVEPEDNPQLKYYAFGLIDGLERMGEPLHDEFPVRLRIVQPRAVHADGCVREWETTVGAIKEWVHDTLVPAMLRTEYDDTLNPGEWCRFCPAKLVCPMMNSLFRAAATANPKFVVNLSDKSIGMSYQYVQAVKFYLKALEEEVFKRLNSGKDVRGTKLVYKKANRVFKDKIIYGPDKEEITVEDLFKRLFGNDAMKEPALKSPAEMEKISPQAKELVKETAFTPRTGLTVALESDPKQGVKVQSSTEAFGAAVSQLTEGE